MKRAAWLSVSPFVALSLLAACATTRTPMASPDPSDHVSLEDARRVVADIYAATAQGAQEPLREPKGLDDVLEILRRDQLDLFAAGVAYAARQEGAEARALQAQIELSWGEAELVLSEILTGLSVQLDARARRLEIQHAGGRVDAQGQAELSWMRARAWQHTRTARALVRTAAEHVSAGAPLAREVIAKYPDSHLGYRVAADYHRLRNEWEAFDEMVRKLEAVNPDSTGLVFLRGVAAAQRDQDRARATAHFEEALRKDGRFTRARVHIALLQTGIAGLYAQLLELEKMNPQHQVAVWAGQSIRDAYERLGAAASAAPATSP